MASLIHATGHGLVAGDTFQFANVVPTDSGVDETVTYYVLASGLTADDFEFSEEDGGTAFVLTYDIESADLVAPDTYEAITDEDSPMAPPAVRHVTHTWPDAPGQPQNFAVSAGYKAIGARWDATSVGDLMFYEFRYAPDDGTGLAPDTTQWVKHQVKTSVIYVDNLTVGITYWCQVRAVDFAGQVVTSDADPTPIDYLTDPDAGYTDSISVVPSQVPQGDIAFDTIIANIISTNSLDASTITTGVLSIDTSDANAADGIRVYDSGTLIGFWDETGLYIADAATGIPVVEEADGTTSVGDLTTVPWVRIYDAGITVFDGSTETDVLDSTGLNADALSHGSLPGGHNVVLNSAFELASFTAVASTKTWDVTADFTGTEVSKTNVTVSNALIATSGIYDF